MPLYGYLRKDEKATKFVREEDEDEEEEDEPEGDGVEDENDEESQEKAEKARELRRQADDLRDEADDIEREALALQNENEKANMRHKRLKLVESIVESHRGYTGKHFARKVKAEGHVLAITVEDDVFYEFEGDVYLVQSKEGYVCATHQGDRSVFKQKLKAMKDPVTIVDTKLKADVEDKGPWT